MKVYSGAEGLKQLLRERAKEIPHEVLPDKSVLPSLPAGFPDRAEITGEQATWLSSHLKGEDGYGECLSVCQEMVKRWPTLILVRGYYHCPSWGERGHWWLINEAGQIVDPTARQFPSGGQGRYVVYSDAEIAERTPIGRCLDCGEDIFEGGYSGTFCTEACAKATTEWLQRG